MSSPFIAVNHPGFVVSDLAAASTFFVDILGFEALPRKGSTSDPGGQRMTDWFGVDATAESRWAFFRLGDDVVELMEWTQPDPNQSSPRNSDLGGRHLALSTPDLEAAIARVKDQPGVTVRAKTDAGFIYISTPFGLEIQVSPV
jgi:catechol 2,3-dioxygenase-like lactoylglutathione lyase family enzyme